MAGSGRRTFTPGEVLTASNVMSYLQDQAVMVFAGTAARGSAIGSAVSDGMVSYLQDTNSVEVYKTVGTAIAGWESNTATQSPNVIINGGFDIWQRGTSFTVGTGFPYTADRWQVIRAGAVAGMTVSRQAAGLTGFQYSLRCQRDSGNTSNAALTVWQSLETVNSIPFAGQTATLSFYARAGANYSGTGLTATIGSGTGTDQNLNIGGFTGYTVVATSTVSLTTSWQRFTVSGTFGSSITQAGLLFQTSGVTGTAGANDWFEITGVQFEAGSTATPFRRNANSLQGELAACQRYYEKSYDLNSAPLTNTIAGLHTYFGSSDASGNIVATVRFAVPKRTASYTVQTYTTTTSGLMGYGRNGASGTSTSYLYRPNENVFHVYCNVGLGWVVANTDFHWTCNAEL